MEERKVLIVEDEKKIAGTLQFGLQENGFEASVCYDGETAPRMFENQPFNLVLLDSSLPGINGYELCKIMRAKDPVIPIIMLTALSALQDKIEGYDAGADDYIIKPFAFKELLMKIRVLLRRTMNQTLPTGTLLNAADLEMNLDTKEVKRGSDTLSLTAKEFQLLEYLLRNKNRVVSRADIAIHVWDIDFDTNTNVIDVYINYLRNKMDKPYGQKLIHTQVGMGYVLKA